MDRSGDDDTIVEMIETIAADVLERIRDDADRRYEFFKAFVALAKSFADHATRAH